MRFPQSTRPCSRASPPDGMPMTTYFTADLHLGQPEILSLRQRPWASIEEHDAALLAAINATVGPDDTLYILGDVTACEDDTRVKAWLSAIACPDRRLVLGNHDKAHALFEPGAFTEICAYRELVVDGHPCCLSHYPMLDWNRGDAYYRTHELVRTAIMLHGHIHSRGTATNSANARDGIWRYDVGVDANDYAPVSFPAIWEFICTHEPRPL